MTAARGSWRSAPALAILLVGLLLNACDFPNFGAPGGPPAEATAANPPASKPPTTPGTPAAGQTPAPGSAAGAGIQGSGTILTATVPTAVPPPPPRIAISLTTNLRGLMAYVGLDNN